MNSEVKEQGEADTLRESSPLRNGHSQYHNDRERDGV